MKISPKLIAEAVYGATRGKPERDLKLVLGRAVQLLKNKGMLGKSNEVIEALQSILDRETSTIRMQVATATGLSPERKRQVEGKIKEKYQAKTVKSQFLEEPELLGGMKIEVGDEVWDNTYKTKLEGLAEFLVKEK